jgi:MSHA biogenesis protein MshQ
VFSISATPPVNGYFGETVGPGVSANLGRFYPASFQLDDPSLTPACGISTYAGLIAQPGPPVQAQKAGQSFAFSGSLSARNRTDEVTRNYVGSFAKLSGAGFVYSDPDDEGIVAVGGSDLSAGSAGNGYFDYSATAPRFLFNAPRAPYDLAIRTTATDSDGVTGSILDAEASDFRLGQARIGNAHGSELQDLAVPFTAAYFTGSGYAPNPLDSCSDFAAVTLGAYQPSDSGTGVPLLAGGPYLVLTGLGNYQLIAPGPDSSGSMPLTYTAPAWLQFDWNGDGLLDAPSGLATFGIYRGAAPLIFRRELYR